VRINWVAAIAPAAYGYLAFDVDALHLICLRDDSLRAAAAGEAGGAAVRTGGCPGRRRRERGPRIWPGQGAAELYERSS